DLLFKLKFGQKQRKFLRNNGINFNYCLFLRIINM
ncbi:MAG: hypothetical protein ACI9AV_000866, partial [Sediminicola sp.]